MSNLSKISAGIFDLPRDFKGILLDAAGVFWGGGEIGVLPGSAQAMEKLVASGKIVGILSNSTWLSSKEIHKLHLKGLEKGKHFHFLLTSGQVTREALLRKNLPFPTPRNTFWLLGEPHPRFFSHELVFEGTGYTQTSDIEDADFIYLSIPHINGEDQVTPETFRKDLEKIRKKNLPMLCSNPDRFAHEGNPSRAVVRQGSLAGLYEEMGGPVFYIGKPEALAYTSALKEFEKHGITDPSEILMVGDTPETDIRGAKAFGMQSALVTKTGITAEKISKIGFEKFISTLPREDFPDYFLERLSDAF